MKVSGIREEFQQKVRKFRTEMANYPKLYKQENSIWCVPACLQTILEWKGVRMSQGEIAERFDKGHDGIGLDVCENAMRRVLNQVGVNCCFRNPYEVKNIVDIDRLIEFALERGEDLLAMYNYGKLHGLQTPRVGRHCSIILDYKVKEDELTMHDPARENLVMVSLRDLVGAMNYDEDRRYGFYFIH